VHGNAQRIRSLEKVRRHAVEQHRGTGIGMHDLPSAVDHDTGKWVVRVENSLDALTHGAHVGVIQRPFPVDRRQAGGHQQLVLFAQRHIEHARQPQDHVAAGRRPARLDETDVAGRYVGLDRKVELGQPTALPPLAHQRAERWALKLGDGGHAASVTYRAKRSHYLSGNCVAYPGAHFFIAAPPELLIHTESQRRCPPSALPPESGTADRRRLRLR